jgi:hypothetical protein
MKKWPRKLEALYTPLKKQTSNKWSQPAFNLVMLVSELQKPAILKSIII